MHQPPTTRREVTKDFPCLICGKDHGCTEFPDGNFICRRQDKDEAGKLGKPLAGGWWHANPRPKTDSNAPPIARVVTPTPSKASNEWLHQVYSALIAGLTLSPSHRAYLADEGWADHEIQAAFQSGLLATLPGTKDQSSKDHRRGILKDLYAKFGATLAEVPGFSIVENDNGHKWASIRAGAGLLFPVVNRNRQIIGLRLRKDEVKLEENRYHWLSSKKTGGPGPGAPPAFYGPDDARTLLITEGEKKAMVALQRPGTANEVLRSVSIPGVTTYGDLLPELTRANFDRIVIALDEELDPKKAAIVEVSRQAIAQHAAGQGIVVEILRWDPAFKGIDDLAKAGGVPVRSTWRPEVDNEEPVEQAAPVSTPATKRKREWLRLKQSPAGVAEALSTAAEARLALREMMGKVMAAARRRDKKVFIAKVAPGIGKSTIADQIFRAARGLTSVYLVGNTANIPADVENRYLGKARVLPDGQTCCSSYPSISRQLEKGVPHDHLCFDSNCTYRNQRRTPEEGVLTYTAYQTAQHIRAFREADLTIADDIAPYQLGFTVGTASLADLDDWLHYLKLPTGEKYGDCKEFLDVLREILRDEDKVPSNSDFGVDFIRCRLQEFAMKLTGRSLQKVLGVARRCLKDLGEPIRQRQLSGHEPRIFLRELTAAVSGALKGGMAARRLLINEAGEWKWYRDLQIGRQRKLRKPGWNQDLEAGPKTVLWLDADADVDAIKALFPEHDVQVIDLSVLALPEEVYIVQDLSQRWGKVSQEAGPSGARLDAIAQADLAEALGRGCKEDKVGFIGHKAFIDAAQLPEGTPRANYYGLRSNNSMKDVEELFVYGTPQVGSDAILELCRAFWGEDIRPDRVQRPRVYKGKASDFTADNVEGWADKRLRAMDEYFSVHELRQATDRGRLLNAGPERRLRITYRGQHSLPYPVDEFVGLATERTAAKDSLLERVVGALRSGEIHWDAGRRTIAEALGSTERKVRDLIKEFPDEIEAARAQGQAEDEFTAPATNLIESDQHRERPRLEVELKARAQVVIVNAAILDGPAISAMTTPTPEPRPPSTPALPRLAS